MCPVDIIFVVMKFVKFSLRLLTHFILRYQSNLAAMLAARNATGDRTRGKESKQFFFAVAADRNSSSNFVEKSFLN